MMKTTTEKCLMCGKEYEKAIEKRRGRNQTIVRRHNSVTCSPLCSRRYEVVSRRTASRFYSRIRYLENELKKNKQITLK